MANPSKRKVSNRRKPCLRCGGDKGDGHPGARYCVACREAMAPIWQQRKHEGYVRKAQRAKDARHAAGRARTQKTREDGWIWCPACVQYLAPSAFPTRKHKQGSCRACTRLYMHAWRLTQLYGISPEDYQRLLDLQEGRCAICQIRPAKKNLAVDHDHDTQQIRGLLCKRCNHGLLGAAHDGTELLKRAIDYLEHPPGKPLRLIRVPVGGEIR